MVKKKKKISRSIVIFDGSNFYHKLKELGLEHTKDFEYSKFVDLLVKDTALIAKYYCVGKVKAEQNDSKARKMMANQQALVTRLQQEKFIIQFGYLLKTNGKYHEKGTDIQIATDLLADALHDRYDICYLITSDSDLLPAVKEVQKARKKVIYVGFKHKISHSLQRVCARSVLFTKTEIKQFLP